MNNLEYKMRKQGNVKRYQFIRYAFFKSFDMVFTKEDKKEWAFLLIQLVLHMLEEVKSKYGMEEVTQILDTSKPKETDYSIGLFSTNGKG